jgi:uncharacterized protein (UPF0548 family)
MFDLGWLRIFPQDTEIRRGAVVAAVVSHLGFWSVNVSRIVYVAEPEPQISFAFAYGTLPEHAETGEERFAVSWNQEDDSVWFDILAFSKPKSLLAQIGYPLGRRLQRRFAHDSLAAMARSVSTAKSGDDDME